jgi:hypothetical protein
MRIAFYGSSLLSSYWNGAATYYRGLLEQLAALGWDIVFYEPDAFDRQAHCDIEPPAWARVVVYPANEQGVRSVLAEAAAAEVVVKASGVGVFDDVLLAGLMTYPRDGALRVFWDVDAPATIAEMRADSYHLLRRNLPSLDLVLTYGGGEPVVEAYTALGAVHCVPIYNALDPAAHFRCRLIRRLPPISHSSPIACPTARRGHGSFSSVRPRGCRNSDFCSGAPAGTLAFRRTCAGSDMLGRIATMRSTARRWPY